MSRTLRHNNGFNKGRDDKSPSPRHWPTSRHPKGYDTRDDDHGDYGAGGARRMKAMAHRLARIYSNKVLRQDLDNFNKGVE